METTRRCEFDGCSKEAKYGTSYSYVRYGVASNGVPEMHGQVVKPGKRFCEEHAGQTKRMHRHFHSHGIGHKAGAVLLNLDKREIPAAELFEA